MWVRLETVDEETVEVENRSIGKMDFFLFPGFTKVVDVLCF